MGRGNTSSAYLMRDGPSGRPRRAHREAAPQESRRTCPPESIRRRRGGAGRCVTSGLKGTIGQEFSSTAGACPTRCTHTWPTGYPLRSASRAAHQRHTFQPTDIDTLRRMASSNEMLTDKRPFVVSFSRGGKARQGQRRCNPHSFWVVAVGVVEDMVWGAAPSSLTQSPS